MLCPPYTSSPSISVSTPLRRWQALILCSRFGDASLLPAHTARTLMCLALSPPSARTSATADGDLLLVQQAAACAFIHLLEARTHRAKSSASTIRSSVGGVGARRDVSTKDSTLAMRSACAVIQQLTGNPPCLFHTARPDECALVTIQDQRSLDLILEQLCMATMLYT